MAFEGLAAALPRACTARATKSEIRLPKLGLAAFSDDIEVRRDTRISIRVAIRDSETGYALDFMDSDPLRSSSQRFALSPAEVQLASALAFARALECDVGQLLIGRVRVKCSPGSWIGAGGAANPGTTAMALSRVYDTVLGALGQAWPGRVGAGSCSLGAVVELRCNDETFTGAVAGGEGATASARGCSAWSGPIVQTGSAAAWPAWLESTETSRQGSGGGGARRGGDGVIREFRVSRSVTAEVGIDRRGNPPHGIDRAGPPLPATISLLVPGEDKRICESWTPFVVPAGATLRIETAGGGGHGFGGYGDIEFDAKDWFGSSSSSS